MSFLSDLFLATAALGAGFFCWILSRRLARLTALDSGLGKAIAVLSSQVDDLTRALASASDAAQTSAGALDARVTRAQETCRQLDLLLAAMHDLPRSAPNAGQAAGPPPVATAHPDAPDPHFPTARPPSPWPAQLTEPQRAGTRFDRTAVPPAGADAPNVGAGAQAPARARILRRRSPTTAI